MTVSFSIDDRGLARALGRHPQVANHNSVVAVRKAFARFRRQYLEGQQFNPKPGRHTGFGRLRRLWFWEVSGDKVDDVGGEFYTPARVAELHEHGAVLRSRRGKFRAVPVGHARTRAGRVKARYREPGRLIRAERARFRFLERGQRVLVFEIVGRLRPHQLQNHNAPLVGKQRFRLVFILQKTVKIEPRLDLRKTWDRIGEREVVRAMNEGIENALEGKKTPGQGPKRRAPGS